jgi:hypothetical protein
MVNSGGVRGGDVIASIDESLAHKEEQKRKRK